MYYYIHITVPWASVCGWEQSTKNSSDRPIVLITCLEISGRSYILYIVFIQYYICCIPCTLITWLTEKETPHLRTSVSSILTWLCGGSCCVMVALRSRLSAWRITFRSRTSPILRSRCSSSVMTRVGSICRIGACLLPRCFLGGAVKPGFSPSPQVVETDVPPLQLTCSIYTRSHKLDDYSHTNHLSSLLILHQMQE
jgi:hypothetical protein